MAALLFMPSLASAKERIVRCAILSLPGGEVQYKGKCAFLPEEGGSFSLSSAAGKDKLYGEIGAVSVTMTGNGTAEVRGLVLDPAGAHNSRWGEAKRSVKDSACWDGEDFRVCAW